MNLWTPYILSSAWRWPLGASLFYIILGDEMKHGTSIEWTHIPGYKGETWNPVTGCTKVSDGCKFCYAERVFPRAYGKDRIFTDVQFHRDRLDAPRRWQKPRAVFVNSMSDLYHEKVGLVEMLQIYKTMIECPRHIFMILTKRPEILVDVLQRDLGTPMDLFPPHIWHGVSVEDQATADERIPLLLQIPSKIRFVSYEPALGPVDFLNIPGCPGFWDGCWIDVLRGVGRPMLQSALDPSPDETTQKIDWVIAGGESGPKARPSHPDWFRKVRDQCLAAGVPFFFKQWGNWGPHPSPPIQGENTGAGIFMRRDGSFGNQGEFWDGQAVAMDKHKDKKAAGDLLDGNQWHQFPEVV